MDERELLFTCSAIGFGEYVELNVYFEFGAGLGFMLDKKLHNEQMHEEC